MVGRNNLVAYDPAVARQAAQTELRSKVVPKVLDCNKPGTAPIELSAEAQGRQRAAVAMELEKIKRRLDERRRRDPTFKETAIDLDRSKVLPFSKFRDYYAVSRLPHVRLSSTAAAWPYLFLPLAPPPVRPFLTGHHHERPLRLASKRVTASRARSHARPSAGAQCRAVLRSWGAQGRVPEAVTEAAPRQDGGSASTGLFGAMRSPWMWDAGFA